jgi:hypothetical protein
MAARLSPAMTAAYRQIEGWGGHAYLWPSTKWRKWPPGCADVSQGIDPRTIFALIERGKLEVVRCEAPREGPSAVRIPEGV